MPVEPLGAVIRYSNADAGDWVRSEFPHPLVTVDYDKNDSVIAISVIVTDDVREAWADVG